MIKSELRTELRQRRRSLSAADQVLAAQQLEQNFFQQNLHLNHHRVGFYWPIDGEIDPRPLAHSLIKLKKQCFLPILDSSGENRIHFGAYLPDAPLKENRFGIPEPTDTEPFSVDRLDLLLVPLVGFDMAGNRLGMGKGFYDRTLADSAKDHARAEQSILPELIGLAHECQCVESISTAPWDIPMHGILTPERFFSIRT